MEMWPWPAKAQRYEPESPSLATPDSWPHKLCVVIDDCCLKLLSLGVVCYAACVSVQSLQLCPTLCDPVDCSPSDSSVHGILQARALGMGCHPLLQGIYPTQESNLHLLHCEQTLYPPRKPCRAAVGT